VWKLIAFVVLLAVMLAVQAPAWLVTDRIAAATGGWIDLRNANGTVWRGSADAYAPVSSGAVGTGGNSVAAANPGIAGAAIALGHLGWRIAGIDWPRRALIVEIEQTPGAARPVTLVAGIDRRMMSGAIRLPAVIAMRVRQLAGWPLGGTITFESDQFAFNGGADGNVSFAWQDASVTPVDLPEAIPLGDVTGRIAADAKGFSVSFSNSGGNVAVSGSGDSRTGQVSLQAEPRATATPSQSAWLQSHLPATAPGRYAIGFTLPRN